METLDILPDQRGYSVSEQPKYYRAIADGAAGNYSKGLEGYYLVDCSWQLDVAEYVALSAFMRARKADMDSFKTKLITEVAFAEDHIAFLVENTYMLTDQQGMAYTVRASLMAKPVQRRFTGTFKLTMDGKPKLAMQFPINKIMEY